MLKLRLKRLGRKKKPFYRLVVIEHAKPRDGRSVEEVGTYDPLKKRFFCRTNKVYKWLTIGVKPTDIVHFLLRKVTLIFQKLYIPLPGNIKQAILQPYKRKQNSPSTSQIL